jgi:LysR family transcriptional regulator, glycine cleavage system transcriptional activator
MPSKRLPNLSALRVFAAAARHGSFVAAADELHVTHGAVSKQIQSLEADLAAALFERRNRGVHLTERGAWLASRLAPFFAGLDRTIRDFYDQNAAPVLTLSCEPTLCLKLLIPNLADLKRACGAEVRVLAAGGAVDFARDRVDLAIRRNDFPLPVGAVSTRVGQEWMGPVRSPHGVADMRLHSATRPDAWAKWDGDAHPPARSADPARDGLPFEHFYMALQAAEAGQGVALASVHMVARDLEAGRLVAPHGFRRDGTDYVALRPRDNADKRLAIATAWIAAKMAANAAKWAKRTAKRA